MLFGATIVIEVVVPETVIAVGTARTHAFGVLQVLPSNPVGGELQLQWKVATSSTQPPCMHGETPLTLQSSILVWQNSPAKPLAHVQVQLPVTPVAVPLL
jgi:hypothetical protein